MSIQILQHPVPFGDGPRESRWIRLVPVPNTHGHNLTSFELRYKWGVRGNNSVHPDPSVPRAKSTSALQPDRNQLLLGGCLSTSQFGANCVSAGPFQA